MSKLKPAVIIGACVMAAVAAFAAWLAEWAPDTPAWNTGTFLFGLPFLAATMVMARRSRRARPSTGGGLAMAASTTLTTLLMGPVVCYALFYGMIFAAFSFFRLLIALLTFSAEIGAWILGLSICIAISGAAVAFFWFLGWAVLNGIVAMRGGAATHPSS